MDEFDLARELERAGISRAELMALTGVGRHQVARWLNGTTPVPVYVRTIISLTRRVRALQAMVSEGA